MLKLRNNYERISLNQSPPAALLSLIATPLGPTVLRSTWRRMPRNVLIALDESAHSLAAYNYAVENIIRKDDTVTFVHVHKTDQILYRTGYTGRLGYYSVGFCPILK